MKNHMSCEGTCFQHHFECINSEEHKVYHGGSDTLDKYCKVKGKENCPCQLYPCHNFQYCQKSQPEYLIKLNNGMCLLCAVCLGRLYFENKYEGCPICFEKKELVTVSCKKHSFCIHCWEKHCKMNQSKCPMCRECIWKWKKT